MSGDGETRYRVERGDPILDRGRILDLWERSGFKSGPHAESRYDWFYLGNPEGRGRVYLLYSGEQLVGAVGAGWRLISLRAAEPPIRAAILVDFVVDPAHRSMFPALQLQRAAREQELRDAQLIYSLPGDKAVPVFRRLGFSAQLSSGDHARVLRSAEFVNRLLPRFPSWLIRLVCGTVDWVRLVLPWLLCRLAGVRGRWHSELPEGIEDLCSHAGAVDGVATGVRHRKFLDWRFQPSQSEWRVLSVTNRRREQLAHFVCKREGDQICVYDLLLADRDAAMLPLLALSLAAWEQGGSSVHVLFGGFTRMRRALSHAGYWLRGERNCFLIQSPGADPAQLPREWWLTKADEDI